MDDSDGEDLAGLPEGLTSAANDIQDQDSLMEAAKSLRLHAGGKGENVPKVEEEAGKIQSLHPMSRKDLRKANKLKEKQRIASSGEIHPVLKGSVGLSPTLEEEELANHMSDLVIDRLLTSVTDLMDASRDQSGDLGKLKEEVARLSQVIRAQEEQIRKLTALCASFEASARDLRSEIKVETANREKGLSDVELRCETSIRKAADALKGTPEIVESIMARTNQLLELLPTAQVRELKAVELAPAEKTILDRVTKITSGPKRKLPSHLR